MQNNYTFEKHADQSKNINDLNLSYLLLAQQLINQGEKDAASFRLGLPESLMDVLKELSISQLVKLASTNQLICQLRINSEAVIDFLTKESRIDSLQPVHTGIILTTDILNALPDSAMAK